MDEEKTPKPQPDPAHQSGTGKGEEKVKQEGKQSGRHDTGTSGGANCPTGKSESRDSPGVNPKDPVDPESPHTQHPDISVATVRPNSRSQDYF